MGEKIKNKVKNLKENSKLSTKIITYVSTTISVVFIIFMLVISLAVTKIVNDSSMELVESLVKENALEFKTFIDEAYSISNSIGLTLKDPGALNHNNRQSQMYIEKLLKSIVKEHENIFGATIAFEPKAFNNEADHMLYYAYTDGENVEGYFGDSYNAYGKEEYYNIPKNTGETYIADPYKFKPKNRMKKYL